MKKLFIYASLLLLALALLASPLLACSSTPAPAPGTSTAPQAKTVTLKMVSFHALNLDGAHFVPIFAQKVKEKSNGQLVINVVGGPEVIPVADMAEAVRTGTMDIALTDASDQVPACDMFDLSRYTLAEEKKSGFQDWIIEQHKAAGFYYLWRQVDKNGFYLYTKFEVKSLADFSGKKMRMAPPYRPIYKGLNVSGVSVPMPDTYTALERSMVEGMGGKHFDVIGFSMFEVLKYWVDHTFYENSGEPIIMNLKTWENLSPNLQKVLIDVTNELTPEVDAYFVAKRTEWVNTLTSKGMKPIKLSDADAKKYLDYAYDNLAAEIKDGMKNDALFSKGMQLLGHTKY